MDKKTVVSAKNVKSTNTKNIKNQKKRKPMKHRILFRGVSILMVVLSIVLIVRLIFMNNFLGIKYTLILIGVMAIVEFCLLNMLNKRFKVIVKIPFLVISILICAGCSFGIYNLNLAAGFVSNIVSNVVTKEEVFDIYVLNESKYESMEDLDKSRLGYFDNSSDTLDEALRLIKKQVTFKNEKSYDDLEMMFVECINKKTDVVYISSSLIELVREKYPSEFEKFKKIGEIVVQKKETLKTSDKDITKEPFVVYISGIDTYGSIGTVSRSDVNILVAVNPKTGKILLVNTPRDYYVKLHSKKAMDKLTHAGIYGVEESMNTLGDLYVTNVDYYIKVNFSSLIKIVDALGGITVNSKYNFSYDGFTFHKGKNKLNGKAALAFSRCRKELPMGDVSRGENQEAVIEALIDKATSPSILKKYTTILKTLEKSFVTNMSEDDIYSFIKFQLNDNPKWAIESANAEGASAYKTTYSAGKTKLYVMEPNEASVSNVKHKLNEILEEN